MRRTQLYRHYDAVGRLLYVGISLSAVARLAEHNTTSHWVHSVRRVDIEAFNSRAAARKAELRAIKREGPLFNIAGQPIEQPADRRSRVIAPTLRIRIDPS